MTKVYIRLRRCAHGVVFLRVLCNLILYTEIHLILSASVAVRLPCRENNSRCKANLPTKFVLEETIFSIWNCKKYIPMNYFNTQEVCYSLGGQTKTEK